jgi:hypothetical protein
VKKTIVLITYPIAFVLGMSMGVFYQHKTGKTPVEAAYNYVDPTAELVKIHPRLQKICDLAGGCFFVDIDCDKYDDTGNSSLKNLTWWSIKAKDTSGYAWYDSNPKDGIYHVGAGDKTAKDLKDAKYIAIENAISDWADNYERRQDNDNKDETTYPHSTPCDSSCK